MKLNKYLYSEFGATFFPIFLSLFFITSIIYLVKIASMTSVITINLIELLTLYIYVIPNILFYTLPVTFFLSMLITLAKLSSEYELIVITSFGLTPKKIISIFLPITIILTFCMLFVSLGLIQKTKYLTDVMIDKKIKEATFNIRASEFGQKFGDWLVYISDKNDTKYEGVKLFKTENNVDQMIISENATLSNESGDLSFVLNQGKSFYFEEDKINQINYEKMIINNTLTSKKRSDYTNMYDYWKDGVLSKRDANKFTFYILVSFFPLLSMFFIVIFGYYNPRYEKNRAVLVGIVISIIYFILVDFLSKKIFYYTFILVPFIWLLASLYLYRKKILKVY